MRTSIYSVGIMAYALSRAHPLLALATIPAALVEYPVWWLLSAVPLAYGLLVGDPYAVVSAVVAAVIATVPPRAAARRLAQTYTLTMGYSYGSTIYSWYVALVVAVSAVAAVSALLLPEISLVVPLTGIVLTPPRPPVDLLEDEVAAVSPVLSLSPNLLRLVFPALAAARVAAARIVNGLASVGRVLRELATVVDPVFSLLPTRFQEYMDVVRRRTPKPVAEVVVAAAMLVAAGYAGGAGGLLLLPYLFLAALAGIHVVRATGVPRIMLLVPFAAPAHYALTLFGYGEYLVPAAVFAAAAAVMGYELWRKRWEDRDVAVVAAALDKVDPLGHVVANASPHTASLALRARCGVPAPARRSLYDTVFYTVFLLLRGGRRAEAQLVLDYYLHRRGARWATEAAALSTLVVAAYLLYPVDPRLAAATALALATTPRLALAAAAATIILLLI